MRSERESKLNLNYRTIPIINKPTKSDFHHSLEFIAAEFKYIPYNGLK